jgi:ribosome-associated protein
LLEAITTTLVDKKAEDLLVLDLTGVTPVADHFILATANSAPHLHALAEETTLRLKQQGVRVSRQEGTGASGWIVLDYFHAVVHLLLAEARDYYALETLWNDARPIPLDADGRIKARAAKTRAAPAPAPDPEPRGEEVEVAAPAKKPRSSRAKAAPKAKPAGTKKKPQD